MQPIFQYPFNWYRFTKLSFHLRSSSQVSPRPWVGGNSVYGPHAQLWMPKLTVVNENEKLWPEIDAFFSRLGGQAGLLRIGDASRREPQYNRRAVTSEQTWSDGSTFTDGTGFVEGLLPPLCVVAANAARATRFVTMAGLPASIAGAVRRGDLFEVRPDGVPSATPNLYQVMVTGSTNADGMTTVEIRPPLRRGIKAGDVIVLRDPTSVFHLVDDAQAEMEISAPLLASFGFSLIEAIENA